MSIHGRLMRFHRDFGHGKTTILGITKVTQPDFDLTCDVFDLTCDVIGDPEVNETWLPST